MLRNRIEAQQKSRKRSCLAEITNEDELEELDNNNEDADAFIGDADEPEHEEAIDEENGTGTEEAHQIHNFDKGTTQMGGISIWLEGFRYTHSKGNAWRCSNRKCQARVIVVEEGEQTMRGYFTNEVHSHLPPTNHERNLNHHPALSDFLIGVREDIDKQLVAARSARNFMQKRHKHYVIQEQVIMRTLRNAIDYDDDLALMDLIDFLGHQIQGYAGQLRDTVQAAGDEAINDSQ